MLLYTSSTVFALGTCAICPSVVAASMQLAATLSRSLDKAERDSLTPVQVIDELKKETNDSYGEDGSARLSSGETIKRGWAIPSGDHTGCVDSRVPAEIVFDAGIGDIFTGRVAGNVVNDDMLGSMEFACAVSGAKLVLVLGHTACGAVKGAIDDVVLGSLTGLLARIKPALAATKFDGERSSKNASYVDAVARTNIVLNVAEIRRRSPVLESLEKKGGHQDCWRDVRCRNWSRGACRLNALSGSARCTRSSGIRDNGSPGRCQGLRVISCPRSGEC